MLRSGGTHSVRSDRPWWRKGEVSRPFTLVQPGVEWSSSLPTAAACRSRSQRPTDTTGSRPGCNSPGQDASCAGQADDVPLLLAAPNHRPGAVVEVVGLEEAALGHGDVVEVHAS